MLKQYYIKNNLIFIFLLCCYFSYSQHLPSRNYTSAKELSNNAIRSLFVDSQSFLWIGTENGIIHKENKKFTHYFEEDGLAMNNCWAIAEDSYKKMWFGSYGAGLSIYDGQSFMILSKENGLVDNEITKLLHFNNKMYVGTSNGVSVVDIDNFQIFSSKPTENKLFRVSSFFEYDAKIYCTTYNSGTYQVAIDSDKVSLTKINNNQYIYAAFKNNDSIYRSNKEYFTKSTLTSFISDTVTSSTSKHGNSIIWDYCLTSKNKMFAGAWGIYKNDGGLFEIANNKFISRNSDFNITSKAILSLAFDSKLNKLYVGSKDAGLFEVDMSPIIKFIPFTDIDILDYETVGDTKAYLCKDVLVIEEGAKKIRLDKKIFKKWEEGFLRKTKMSLPKHEDYFYELDYNTSAKDIKFYDLKYANNAFWLNTTIGVFAIKKDGSLLRYLPLHTEELNFTNQEKLIESVPYEGVRVYEDLDKLKYTYFKKENKNTPKMIVNSLKKGDKTYFLSIFSGLYIWQNNQFTSYLYNNIWLEKKLKHITKMNNNIAVSNEFGDVFIINDEQIFNVITKIARSKIQGNSISFLESYHGYLLIGTEKGLTIYKNDRFLFIDEEQGLKQPILSSKIEGDNLFIGSKQGYYTIQINTIEQKRPLVTKIKLNKFKINNENISIDKIITEGETLLDYNQNTVLLTFSTNAHPYPDKLAYQYRLNSNSEWTEISSSPEIFLPYLSPKKYQVEVRVSDVSTGLNYSQVILSMSILPPFWETWWFISSIVFLSLIAVYLFYKHKVEQNKKIEVEKAIIKNRIEEVKMEALLAQMNPHFIFNAMNSIQKYILENDTDSAVLFLGEFSKLIRKNLDHCTRPFISIYEEIEYLNSYIYVENKRFNNSVLVELNVDEAIDTYFMEIPSMIIQPFIENVFVHAFPPGIIAPKLNIDFSLVQENIVVCTIKDNGVGMVKPSKKIHQSKGILLIKERFKLLGYDVKETLRITSSKNEGTSIVISLKI